MNLSELEAYIETLENVEREENFGYNFFFVGDDHRLAFVTIGHSDNEFDRVSNLDREGIFRVNIGVRKATFDALIGDYDVEDVDYSMLDVFMPHPHYAKQNFICILNPSHENADATQELILEAHSIAAARLKRRTGE
jgi:hypothetical protein